MGCTRRNSNVSEPELSSRIIKERGAGGGGGVAVAAEWGTVCLFFLCCGWPRQQVGVGWVEVDGCKKEVGCLEELSDFC